MINGVATYLVMKLAAAGLVILSYVLAAKYMTDVYVEKVYVNNESPPNLSNMAGTALGIGAALVGLMFLGLVAASKIWPSNAIFEGNALTKFLVDFLCGLVIYTYAGVIISNVMYKKKYFQYKDEGLRAIRALRDIMYSLAPVIMMFPYGMAFQGMLSK